MSEVEQEGEATEATKEVDVSGKASAAKDASGSDTTVLTDRTTEEKAQEAEAETKAVIPEKYTFKLPDGIALHPELQSEFETKARELRLSNDQAQALVDLDLKRRTMEADALVAERKAWVEAGKQDKEFGGARYEETRKLAQAGFNKFADDEARGLLEVTGLGDHPSLLRLFAKVAKAFGEDQTAGVGSAGGGEANESPAQKFYRLAKKPNEQSSA